MIRGKSKEERIRARTHKEDLAYEKNDFWSAVQKIAIAANLSETFPMSSNQLYQLGAAKSSSALSRRRKKLCAATYNGKCFIQILPERHSAPGASQTYRVRIQYKLAPPMHSPEAGSVSEAGSVFCKAGSVPYNGSRARTKDLDPKILDLRSKKEPKPNTYKVVTTGVCKEVATLPGSGALLRKRKNHKKGDNQIVTDMINFGVNRTIIDRSLSENGKDWVKRIYREFNQDVCNPHNMASPAAVLATRLKSSDESWRADLPVKSGPVLCIPDSPPEVPPEFREKWQGVVERQFPAGTATPEAMHDITRDFAVECGVPFTHAMTLLNYQGVEVEGYEYD